MKLERFASSRYANWSAIFRTIAESLWKTRFTYELHTKKLVGIKFSWNLPKGFLTVVPWVGQGTNKHYRCLPGRTRSVPNYPCVDRSLATYSLYTSYTWYRYLRTAASALRTAARGAMCAYRMKGKHSVSLFLCSVYGARNISRFRTFDLRTKVFTQLLWMCGTQTCLFVRQPRRRRADTRF